MHIALVARAFGAQRIVYCGEHDKQFELRVKKIVEQWGGSFSIEYNDDWQIFVKKQKEKNVVFVHLTMYGEPIRKKIEQIKNNKKMIIMVGSQKVPIEAYELADYNISVTNQPHSEIGALSVFLDNVFEGKEFEIEFEGAKKQIIASERTKKVIDNK